MNHNKDTESFLNSLKEQIGDGNKTLRDCIDWQAVRVEANIHYNTLLTYLSGNGPDQEIMDRIMQLAKVHIKTLHDTIIKNGYLSHAS